MNSKGDMIYIIKYDGILLNPKKEWNNAICSNMDGLRDHNTKWSKSDRERYIISAVCGTLKKMIQIN